MLLSKLVVVTVVRRGNLQCTCTKVHAYVFVGNNANATVEQRYKGVSSLQRLITGIIGMYTDGRVAHNGLWPYGSNNDILIIAFFQVIAEVVKSLLCLLADNLFVAEGGFCAGIPIDHSFAPVDISFFV